MQNGLNSCTSLGIIIFYPFIEKRKSMMESNIDTLNSKISLSLLKRMEQLSLFEEKMLLTYSST
jgi:hypothetical protein